MLAIVHAGEERWDIRLTAWLLYVRDHFVSFLTSRIMRTLPSVHTGEERWDIRLTAWLLYVLDAERKAHGGTLAADGSSMWSQYLAMLPPEREMCCLLNYDGEEAKELQLPQLLVSVVCCPVEVCWCAAC